MEVLFAVMGWGGIHGTFCERWFSLVVARGYPCGGKYMNGKGEERKGWRGDVRLERSLDSEMDRGRRERENH